MSSTYRTVQHILQKELLVPVKKIKSAQRFTSDLGLSTFELNVLLYFVEEKYQVNISNTQVDFTVKELITTIEDSTKDTSKNPFS